MKFESKLAERIASKEDGKRSWKTYACLVGAVFLVLNLTASSLAAPSAVIHIGSKTAVVEYMGSFDGKANVVRFGLSLSTDSAFLRMPFKGHLSDLSSLSFSEFVEQTGGGTFEPYVVMLLPAGMSLICHPEDSYASSGWYLPFFEWQSRDLVSKGLWSALPEEPGSELQPLSSWIVTLGDPQITCIQLCVGPWTILESYASLVGDLSIDGALMNIANAKRI